jgi:hypothetical protein
MICLAELPKCFSAATITEIVVGHRPSRVLADAKEASFACQLGAAPTRKLEQDPDHLL